MNVCLCYQTWKKEKNMKENKSRTGPKEPVFLTRQGRNEATSVRRLFLKPAKPQDGFSEKSSPNENTTLQLHFPPNLKIFEVTCQAEQSRALVKPCAQETAEQVCCRGGALQQQQMPLSHPRLLPLLQLWVDKVRQN